MEELNHIKQARAALEVIGKAAQLYTSGLDDLARPIVAMQLDIAMRVVHAALSNINAGINPEIPQGEVNA